MDYNGTQDFVHLHSHSLYSSLDGVASPQQYAENCKSKHFPAMTLTEHGHLGSIPDAFFAFKQYGVKYFPGCEIYYNDYEPTRQKLVEQGFKLRSPAWKQENPELNYRINRNRHLTIIAKNQKGIENLIKLTTQAYETGLYGAGTRQYNRIWFEKLAEYKEGLIVLSGCLNGPVCHELRFKKLEDKEGKIIVEKSKKERFSNAIDYIKKFKEVFGEDYYIELQMPGIEDDHVVFHQLIEIADHFKLKTVLANDCHYLNRADFLLQKAMMAISQEVTIDSPDLFHVNSDEQFFKTRAELYATFKSKEYSVGLSDSVFDTACDNTLEVADKCEQMAYDSTYKIPKIEKEDELLRSLVAKRLMDEGFHKVDKKYIIDGREVTYVQQAKIELDRFIDKGFASYFLITRDLITFGRSNGWPFNPRGSGGGSLVCYLLGIHNLNPLEWNLSFDRFLSPSRGGYNLNLKMPDPIKG